MGLNGGTSLKYLELLQNLFKQTLTALAFRENILAQKYKSQTGRPSIQGQTDD